jgi:hypothetical protein
VAPLGAAALATLVGRLRRALRAAFPNGTSGYLHRGARHVPHQCRDDERPRGQGSRTGRPRDLQLGETAKHRLAAHGHTALQVQLAAAV